MWNSWTVNMMEEHWRKKGNKRETHNWWQRKSSEWKLFPCFSSLGFSMPSSTCQTRCSGVWGTLSLFKSKCRVWRPLPYLVTLRSLGLQISPGQVHQRGITNIHPNLFRLGEMDNWLFSNLLPGWLDTKPVYKVNCLPAHMPKYISTQMLVQNAGPGSV